jgi:hypothetical protein
LKGASITRAVSTFHALGPPLAPIASTAALRAHLAFHPREFTPRTHPAISPKKLGR